MHRKVQLNGNIRSVTYVCDALCISENIFLFRVYECIAVLLVEGRSLKKEIIVSRLSYTLIKLNDVFWITLSEVCVKDFLK
jgi:hypothetical protein